MKPIKLPILALSGLALSAASADAAVVFTENFESPDVTGYSQGSIPSSWVATGSGFGSDRHGLIDKDSGAFTAASGNDQAYAFRYTSSPEITSTAGSIGTVTAGQTITVTFQVQQDLGDVNGSGGDGTWYDAQLLVFSSGEARTAGTSVASAFGQVATGPTFKTISFDWTPDATDDAAVMGYDYGVQLKDVWASGNSRTSGVVDNVSVDIIPEPSAALLGGLGALLLLRRRR